MLEEQSAVDQSEATATETVDTETTQDTTQTEQGVTKDDNQQATQQGDQTAPEAKDDFIGEVPKELEPMKKDILEKYYSKTRELAAQRQSVKAVESDAKTLRELMGYKPFQDWYNAEKNGGHKPEQSATLTEDELDAIRNDPSKFDAFMTKKMESLIESKYGGKMQSFENEANSIRKDKQLSDAIENYGEEFTIAHKAGDLDEYYDKGNDYETAFAKWKLKNPTASTSTNKEISDKAAQMVNKSKSGVSEKPSSGGNKLPNIKIVKAKTFDEAFDAMFNAKTKGQEVKIEKGG